MTNPGITSNDSNESQKGADIVIAATSSKIRTFLYEIAEGTSNYRSLHSLTEQVEHQYHGRFIVELIQNAHDALLTTNERSENPARIEIVLKNEGEFGTLYVANDGKPFSHSNFNSLSQLGQSDKNPQESIGNKGIGFRSVLEITRAPEIYSRLSSESTIFDGFCFKFSPEVITRLSAPIMTLLLGKDDAESPFCNKPLVDWDTRLLSKFRATINKVAKNTTIQAEKWIKRELSYLSPYLMPFPIKREGNDIVMDFERRGFATLIRLPLKNATASALVREKIDALDDSAVLFLEKLTSLVLSSDYKHREIKRKQATLPATRRNGREVSILDESNNSNCRYWVWTQNISLKNESEKLQKAVHQLPGKWPDLQEAMVSIGVKLGEEPEPGTLSIFLPTLLETGCATQINAPFFGDMSRTLIDFGSDEEDACTNDAIYNRFLLSQAAQLAVSVIVDELIGKGVDEARAIVDLLAQFGSNQKSNKRWHLLICKAAETNGINILESAWFLSDSGWRALVDASLLPIVKNPQIFSPAILRKHATFAAYIGGLDSRRELISVLSKSHDIPPDPLTNDVATTVESVAQYLKNQTAPDWNGFWSDVHNLFKGDCSELTGMNVLIGNDGQLHAAGKDCTVFFIPRQGASEDEDIEVDSDVKNIPLTLRPFVAFLSEQIQSYEEINGRLQQTMVRKMLLDSNLVNRFRREDILNYVLSARTPDLPIPLNSPDAELCSDILSWTLRLVSQLVDQDKGVRTIKILRNLPAPCIGGWYALSESAFGPGWQFTQGDNTFNYLTRVKTTESKEAIRRLLLPPKDYQWATSRDVNYKLLKDAGVFDGLRLVPIDSKSWGSRFDASKFNFQLPKIPPSICSEKQWDEYISLATKQAKPTYNDGSYIIQRFFGIPGLEKYEAFDDDTRLYFMDVVLGSMGCWDDAWDRLTITRIKGNPDSINLTSPLAFFLSKLPWLGIKEGENIEWSRPADRWYVPTIELSRNRKWQFSHLNPLPSVLANRLDLDIRLATLMIKLGTPRFDPESKSQSTLLLDALADAVVRDVVPEWNVFLGQVRSAWRGFEPTAASRFPTILIVQRGSESRLSAERPDAEGLIYLPDSTKSFVSELKQFSLPIIAIEAEDAKRLAVYFTNSYGDQVVQASKLKLEAIVNGEKWDGIAKDRLLESPELDWVIPVLLTISAFYGTQSQGTASDSFRKLLELFRDARLSIVGKIDIGIVHNEVHIASLNSVPALWIDETNTLLLSHNWKSNMPNLSEAFSNLLDRDNLEIPIKLLLGYTGFQPTYTNIINALDLLKISESHYLEVREQWRGDIGQIIEMLIPLISILRSDVDFEKLVDLDSEELIIEFIDYLEDEQLNGTLLIDMARGSTSMYDFGSKAFERFGNEFQMNQWNSVQILRNIVPLKNRDAHREFRVHLSSSAQILRCFLATLSVRSPGVENFMNQLSQLDTLACPEAFETSYWHVSYNLALSTTIPLFVQWGANKSEIKALRDSDSSDILIDRLTMLGIDVSLDPIQVAGDNRELLSQALKHLQQAGLAWALENEDQNVADWEFGPEQYLSNLNDAIEASVYTFVWDNSFVWKLLQMLPVLESSKIFWTYILEANSFDELIVKLGFTGEELSLATSRLVAISEETQKRKKIVQVCGADFDGSDNNLSGLWKHICLEMPLGVIDKIGPISLSSLSPLSNLSSRSPPKVNTGHPPSGAGKNRTSKSLENLVGLSGEIHAFRKLQQEYGASSVSASSWVSENSLFAFPDNKPNTNDGAGSDFKIIVKGYTYYVEVKSSEAESESFKMGSSEIRLAMHLAKKSHRNRKEVYLILRVFNALSLTPTFQLLPNPYDLKYQALFVVEEADARIRYRSKAILS